MSFIQQFISNLFGFSGPSRRSVEPGQARIAECTVCLETSENPWECKICTDTKVEGGSGGGIVCRSCIDKINFYQAKCPNCRSPTGAPIPSEGNQQSMVEERDRDVAERIQEQNLRDPNVRYRGMFGDDPVVRESRLVEFLQFLGQNFTREQIRRTYPRDLEEMDRRGMGTL